MKRILLAACLAGCALAFGAQTVLAESVKVPVNKISSEGVGEAIGFVVFEDDGKGGMGWKPRVGLEDGLRDAYSDFLQNQHKRGY